MKEKRVWKRFWAGLLVVSMIFPNVSNIVYAENESSENVVSTVLEETVKSTEHNYMSDEEYTAMGFGKLQDINSFVDEDLNPLEGYQPSIQNELYIGHLNHPDNYQGDFATAESIATIDADSMNLNTMQNKNIGGKIRYYDYSKMQTQCINAVGLTPGDMNEKGAELNPQILIEARLYQDTDGADSSDFRVQAYSMVDGKWKGGEAVHDRLDKKDDWVGAITIREHGGYNAMTTGDFDADGYNEVAVFNPYGASCVGHIYIYQPKLESDGTYSLVEDGDFSIADVSSEYKYASGTQRPLVSMTTTDMSGKDEIVLSVSYTVSTPGGACKPGIVAVISNNGSGYAKTWWDHMKVSDSEIFRMHSAIPADLNMDGQDEIVIAGHRNYNFKDGSSRGSLDWDNMYINVLLHNGDNYYLAWEGSNTPKVPMHPDLHLDYSEIDPVSLTAGKYFSGTTNDVVFCEGVFYHFTPGEGSGNDQIVNGEFTHNPVENLKFSNTDEAFVGAVATGYFVEDQRVVEQTVVMHGNNARSDDECDVNITWFYGSTDDNSGQNVIKQIESNNDYINNANEDDHGTCVVLAPVNVDDDSYYIKYKERYYGYTNPEVIAVMISQPYWQELKYSNDGSTSYTMSYTTGSGIDQTWDAGLDFGLSLVGKGELFGNGGGAGFDGNAALSYVGTKSNMKTETEETTFTNEGGQDMVVATVIPVVSYYYDLINPNTGEIEPFIINTSYTPAFANISVEKYNSVAKQFNEGKAEEEQLTIIDLDEIYKDGYIPGNPSSYPSSISEIEDYTESNKDAYRTSKNVSLDINGDGAIGLTLAQAETNTSSHGVDASLGIGGTLEANLGFKLFGLGAQTTLTVTGHVTGGYSHAWATTNTDTFEYAGQVANIPADGQTGVDAYGNPTSNYAFGTSLVQWNHEQKTIATSDDGEVITKTIPYIGYLTTVPVLPTPTVTNLMVTNITKTAAVLNWTTPIPRVGADGKTVEVDYYELYMSEEKDGEYLPVTKDGKKVTIGGNETTYTVTGLEKDTSYYFRIKSFSKMNDPSMLSNIAKAKTLADGAPIITKQPASMEKEKRIDDTYEFDVEAKPYSEEGQLSYQWEMLEDGVWKEIKGETGISYDFSLDEELYFGGISEVTVRCNVTETHSDGTKINLHSQRGTLSLVSPGALNSKIETKLTNKYYPEGSPGTYQPNVCYQEEGKTIKVYTTLTEASGGGYFEERYAYNGKVYLYDTKRGKFVDGYPKDITFDSPTPKAYFDLPGLEKGMYYLVVTFEGNEGYVASSSGTGILYIEEGVDIIYELDGGINDSKNVDRFIPEWAETIKLYEPRKENYVFEGWYLDSAFKNKLLLSSDEDGSYILETNSMQNDSITLYAKWSELPEEYAVTYELNGGTNAANNPTTVVEGQDIPLKDPIKRGYAFEGWYLDAEFKTPCTSASASYGKDITLYAKWSDAVKYRIQYLVGNGTNAESNPATYTIESEEIVFADPTYEGYIFTGWYEDAELTKKVTSIPKGSTGDVTVYAGWVFDDILEPNEDGVYEIDSYEDLVAAAVSVLKLPEKYADATFVQTANITCGMKEWSIAIGTQDEPFNGTYEGNGHYVLGLRPTENVVGIFGVIGSQGLVKDLSVIDFDYSESSMYAGGIAGINYGTINGCGSGVNLASGTMIFRNGQTEAVPITTLDSEIKATKLAGGIVAINEGSIINSRNNSEVTITLAEGDGDEEETVPESYAGGIAGVNNGIIMNVYQNGEINGTVYAGGIAGSNDESGYIQYGYNSSKVAGEVAGAIVGLNRSISVEDMYYEDLVANVAGDTEGYEIQATQMSAAEMKAQEFADTLNGLVKGNQFLTWEYDAEKNLGYPKFGTEKAEENLMISVNRGELGSVISPDDGKDDESDDPGNDDETKPNRPSFNKHIQIVKRVMETVQKVIKQIQKWFFWKW